MATEETISATKAQRELEAQAKKINKYRINLIGMEEKLEIAAAKLRESNAEKEQLISQLQQASQVHSQALKQLEENSNMATEEAVSATKAQSKEIKQYRKTIKCVEKDLQIASRKLLESNADRVRLKYHLNQLMDQLQQKSNIVEPSLTVEGQVENLKQKLVEKEDLHKKLKAQVLNLTKEVECWRGKANTIRRKSLELEQKEVQLNRVKSLPGHALPMSTKKAPSTLKSAVKRKSSPIEPGKSLLALGRGQKSSNVDRLSGTSQTIVAEDPYLMTSDSDD